MGFCLLILKLAGLLNLLLLLLVNLILLYFSGDSIIYKKVTLFLSFSFHFLCCTDLFCWPQPQGPRSTVFMRDISL